jgi:hypothetical protein
MAGPGGTGSVAASSRSRQTCPNNHSPRTSVGQCTLSTDGRSRGPRGRHAGRHAGRHQAQPPRRRRRTTPPYRELVRMLTSRRAIALVLPLMCHVFVTAPRGTDQPQEGASGQTRWSERCDSFGGMSADTVQAPENRKVGGSTPPLATIALSLPALRPGLLTVLGCRVVGGHPLMCACGSRAEAGHGPRTVRKRCGNHRVRTLLDSAGCAGAAPPDPTP